jgi:acyl-CoA reductase-like NAD-dependent aldehyde dehydrogenase
MWEAIHPVTGQVVRRVPVMSGEEVERRVQAAARAFEEWRRSTWEERAQALRALARALRTRAGELARLMAEEMGKPVVQGRAEVEKCAWVCEFYAEEWARLLQPEPVATD